MKYECKVCSSEIESFPSQRKLTCGKECHKILQRKGKIIKCALCNRDFYKPRCKMNSKCCKSGFYFCSKKCKGDAQTMPNKFAAMIPSHYNNCKRRYREKAFRELKNECNKCSENRKFILTVHHMDGDRTNSRLKNLEILCFNCHVTKHLRLLNGEYVYDPKVLTIK